MSTSSGQLHSAPRAHDVTRPHDRSIQANESLVGGAVLLDRPPPSINRWTRRQHECHLAASADGVRRALEPIRSGRGGAGRGWGGAGTLPRVAEGEVREDLPDDRGIVQRGDQA